MAHQCPWCELKYTWQSELSWHMRDDHASRQLPQVAVARSGDHDVLALVDQVTGAPVDP